MSVWVILRIAHPKKFCSSFTGKKISDKEYDQALKVWSKFKMKP